mgnify:CR=1 FL=1
MYSKTQKASRASATTTSSTSSPRSLRTTISPGRATRIANEGMPISKVKGAKKGDLVVEWNVEFPDKLSQTQRSEVRKALA